ncbi:MAG: CCA tRNA nucleotidyltransferase [Myxococcota bacterium]
MSTLRGGANKVAEGLRRAGYQAFLAGGCVRDLLLGLEPKDYDIVTDARPEQIQTLFRHTRMVGANFGVVQVRLAGFTYEVATFRTEGSYTDGRRPDSIQYADRPEDDIERRDFTINALLMDPVTEAVIDHVGGRADLRQGIVRAVGDPDRRFGEDRLRMLRAVRFSTRFGFDLDPGTAAAIRRHAPELGDVSVERITGELEAIFHAERAYEGLALLEDLRMSRVALPFLPEDPAERAHRFRSFERPAWQSVQGIRRIYLAWAFLLGDAGHVAIEEAMRKLRLSRDRLRAVQLLVGLRPLLFTPGDTVAVRRVAADEDLQLVLAYAEGIGADQGFEAIHQERAQLDLHPLPPRPILSGNDLKAMGYSPGPIMKDILGRLDKEVLRGAVTEPDQARQWVLTRFPPDREPR